jgi:hypothetical protein
MNLFLSAITRTLLGIVVIVVLIVSVPSCKQGDTGPVGPRGQAGNANVMVDTFSLSNSDWLWNSSYWYSTGPGSATGWFTRYHDRVDSTMITQGILDSGMVLVYFTPYTDQPNQWVSLPFSFPSFSNAYYTNYVYETFLGKVRLHIFFNLVDNSGTLPTLSTFQFATHKFKIVTVAGNLASRMVQTGIDRGNEQAVMRFLQENGSDAQ